MRKFIIPLFLIASTSFLSAAYVDTIADGRWDEPATWKSEPEAGNGVNIRYALTIDQALSDSYKDFVVGDTNGKDTFAGTLNLTPKASVTLTGTLNIARNVPKAGNGTVVIDGGKIDCAAVNTGSGHNSSSTGILTLQNGASLSSTRTINIGHASGQTGLLKLIGSKNKVSTGTLTVRGQGTLAFVADANGFSTIEAGGRVLYDSSKLSIDGSAYTGGTQTFTLIDGSQGTNYKGVDASAEISGFAKGYSARVIAEGQALKLEVTKK